MVVGVTRVEVAARGVDEDNLVPLVDEVVDSVSDGGGESHC